MLDHTRKLGNESGKLNKTIKVDFNSLLSGLFKPVLNPRVSRRKRRFRVDLKNLDGYKFPPGVLSG